MVAREAQNIAEDRWEEITRLSDLTLLAELEQLEKRLWPARSSVVGRMNTWLDEARELLARLPIHEQDLAALREQGQEVAVETSEEGLEERRWTFADRTLQWRHDNLSKLVEGIQRFAGHEDANGLLVQDLARKAYEDDWDDAINEIALGEIYDSLELEPIEGLVPIGEDPLSGLWEFWHVESEARAGRDMESGELIRSEEMGIVLVLIPGETTWIGSQETNPNGPNYDPARLPERTLREVTLEPYFLSKYEMTQGQWRRLTGRNPSGY